MPWFDSSYAHGTRCFQVRCPVMSCIKPSMSRTVAACADPACVHVLPNPALRRPRRSRAPAGDGARAPHRADAHVPRVPFLHGGHGGGARAAARGEEAVPGADGQPRVAHLCARPAPLRGRRGLRALPASGSGSARLLLRGCETSGPDVAVALPDSRGSQGCGGRELVAVEAQAAVLVRRFTETARAGAQPRTTWRA